jgi:hypothetical protein
MTARDSITRARARTRGVVVIPLHGGARSNPRPGSVRDNRRITRCTKDGCKLANTPRMSGADLSSRGSREAPSEKPAFQPYRGKPAVRKCVQLRLVCSAGGRPAGAKVRRPVVWIAGWREIKILKPIDKVSLGETTSCRAVTTVNVNVASKGVDPRAEPASVGRRQHGVPKSDRCGISISAG